VVLARPIPPAGISPDHVAGPVVSNRKDALSMDLAAAYLDAFKWLGRAHVLGDLHEGRLSA
jgi:hypothetical protein